ncbi:RNA polymerase-associated protein RapA [Aquirhabdus sp.]|uniref:RNA polymerase-associated protein RapA n=1 Tax=Aquirhabdus sp. TaxID=2824160 RepID=UPI00396CA244
MQEFAVGQRWLSDTESELGLGVLVDVDERTISILFPKSDETRVYSRATAPLSRIIFAAGDSLTDQDGIDWLVISTEVKSGVLRYHCSQISAPEITKTLSETRLAAHLQLARPLERLLASQLEPKEWYDLRIEALLMQARMSTSLLRGMIGPRVGLIPHQFYIAHEVGRRLAPRVLLADEVGLGKTIEAGLIMHQQLVTGRSERILVLVPDSLQYQWMIEMRRRFNLNFSLFDLERTAFLKENDPEANPFATESCIIASIDLLLDHEDLKAQALDAGFDLLVVDEAHHLTWHEDVGGNDRYDVVAEFADQTAGVLLLTATPEQLGVDSHFARLRLLDPERFDTLNHFLDEEANYASTAQVAEALMQEGLLDDEQHEAIAALLGHPVEDTPDARYRAINELLDRHGTGRILFRNTREAIQGFQGRDCLPAALPAPEGWPITGSLRQQMWPEEQQLDGEWMQTDPRVPWLLNLLKTELKHQKVLLIARSGPVVESLELALRVHGGIRTAMFHEAMSLLERDQAAAYFADDTYGAQILLCSEIGSEGRNFQFASNLVLFDMPSNPDVLEQRIGRLDRIGQQNRIQIHVPYLMATAQERMFRWYNEALDIFGHISPTAQVLQENHLVELKDHLLSDTGEQFDALLAQVNDERLELETELQAGRDRLLEFNSCRPKVASRIVQAMQEQDAHNTLPDFMLRFLSSTNIEHDEQHDGSLIIHSSDQMLVDGLDLPEDGMTVTFHREQALTREDTEYLTVEHPLMGRIFELVRTQPFGNANVAVLRSSVIPAGKILIEAWFRVEVIAPKVLNLNASLPQQLIRVLISESGQDLSARINSAMLHPQIHALDMNNARQVVKLRRDVIEARYKQAEELARAQIKSFSQTAQKRYGDHLQQELDRLIYLKAHNPSVRDDEIDRLTHQRAQGLQLLEQLSLVPDSIRVLVVMK